MGKKRTRIYRHGDVLIVPRKHPIPAEATPMSRQGARLVLAEGEATGHAHAILDPAADLYEIVTPGDVEEMRQRFLLVEAEQGVALEHEEHATLTIPPGEYDVIRQVEYEPERLRQVAD